MADRKNADMGIAIVIGGNQRGGAERQVSLLSQELLRQGIAVTVFFMNRPVLFRKKLNFGQVKCIYLWNSRYTSKISLLYFRFLLKRFNIQLIHSFILEPIEYSATACVGTDIKHIGSIRDIFFSEDENARTRLKDVSHYIAFITCNCTAMRDLMINLKVCQPEKTRVIYNGIVIEAQQQKSAMNHQNNFTVLFVGSLKGIKDPLSFVKAGLRVLESSKDYRFLIAGDGPLRGEIEQMIAASRWTSNFILLGSLPNEEIPYNEVDLLVSTSRTEASSNAVLEALAHGIPVVGTAVGGTVEILEGKEFGRLVASGDIEAIAAGIKAFYAQREEERRIISQQARTFIMNNYSLKRMAQQYVDLYREVLQE